MQGWKSGGGWGGMWKQREKEDNGMNNGGDRREWCGQLSLSDPGRPRERKGKSSVASLERTPSLYLWPSDDNYHVSQQCQRFPPNRSIHPCAGWRRSERG